jgi:hypothetical protein
MYNQLDLLDLMEELLLIVAAKKRFSSSIAIATCIRTNLNPNNVGRRFTLSYIIWVLCPNKTNYGYI